MILVTAFSFPVDAFSLKRVIRLERAFSTQTPSVRLYRATASTRSKHAIFHDAPSTGLSASTIEDHDKSGSAPGTVLYAALLVAGTTIGGGFLALPTVVVASGFMPSAVALSLTWLFSLAQSFVLVQVLDDVRDSEHVSHPGVSVAAKATFGRAGEAVVALLLVVLTAATLVSQISRAGILFSSSLVPYSLASAASALLVAAVVFGPSRGIEFASEANATLTVLFLLSACGVAFYGTPLADWSRLITTKSWSAVPDAVPIFLQLLVYGEILPVVCQLLNYKMKLIRLAIGLGSFLTLVLQISWAALGICLVSKPGVDPVSALVSTGPSSIRFSLFGLSITAILTTILGSYLAMLSAYKDLTNADICTNRKSRLKAAALIVLPTLAISCASPKVFLKAIDFAGSYPVLLLWGVVPPLMRLAQPNSRRPWLLLLATLSLGMVGMSAKDDITWFMHCLR